jgi:hypothetical protein
MLPFLPIGSMPASGQTPFCYAFESQNTGAEGSTVRRFARGGAALSGAAYSALVPICALVFLSPTQYGLFSVPYLIYAFGLSLQLSVVTEAWTRKRVADGVTAQWPAFWTALSTLSAAVGVVAGGVVAVALGASDVWWLAGLAVTIALLRNGARYFDVAGGHGLRVLAGDISGVIAFVVVVAGLCQVADPFASIVGGWLASALAGLLWTGARLWRFGSNPLSWVRTYSRHIKPLLADSLLLDVGSIGTPFLLAPFLGATKFGIYRGIANVSLPVRLILEPLRPSIGGQAPASVFSKRNVAFVVGTSTLLTVACFLALEFVVPVIGLQESTLGALTAFAIPASLFVLVNFVGHYYYIVCRARASQRQIISGRLVQAITAIAIPIAGYLAFDLDGAIWGFVAASGASALFWAAIAWRAVRQIAAERPSTTAPVPL